ETCSSPRPRHLRDLLQEGRFAASQRIAQLAWLSSFGPLAFLLVWRVPLAIIVEAWRRTSGKALQPWLTALGEFEALCALAGYAYENPDDVFPELIADGLCFDAFELGHPLLPRRRCVRNDVSFGGVRSFGW